MELHFQKVEKFEVVPRTKTIKKYFEYDFTLRMRINLICAYLSN